MTDIPVPPSGESGVSQEPTPRSNEEISKLHNLHVLLTDTVTGYDKIIEKAQPEFVEVAQAFRGAHVAQAKIVSDMLVAMGAEVDEDGSFFGLVNKTVVEVRSWFDEISHNIIDAMADGEKRVIEAIEDAIEASPSPERRSILENMKSEIKALLHRYAPDKA